MTNILKLAFLALIPLSQAIDNGLGLTPPMGWNSWNKFGCDINETNIKDAADQMIKLGLFDLGYNYVNIDDCWMLAERTLGHMVADPKTFPNGMKALGDYIHERGMKYGVYSSAGNETCEYRAGSLGFEEVDAQDWANWGFDYLKYDNCGHWDEIPGSIRYEAMRKALNKTGRPMFYSICSWGDEDIGSTYGNKTGNAWRTTHDIMNFWEAVKGCFLENALYFESAAPGGWNDPDMLEIGNEGLTPDEERTHFALWAISKAPLLIGCDLTKVSSDSLNIMKNQRLITLNQDPLGRQGYCVMNCDLFSALEGSQTYLSYNNHSGKAYFALVVPNWSDWYAEDVTVDFTQITELNDPRYQYKISDLWTGQTLGFYQKNITLLNIPPHGNAALRLDPILIASEQEKNAEFVNTEESQFLSE